MDAIRERAEELLGDVKKRITQLASKYAEHLPINWEENLAKDLVKSVNDTLLAGNIIEGIRIEYQPKQINITFKVTGGESVDVVDAQCLFLYSTIAISVQDKTNYVAW